MGPFVSTANRPGAEHDSARVDPPSSPPRSSTDTDEHRGSREPVHAAAPEQRLQWLSAFVLPALPAVRILIAEDVVGCCGVVAKRKIPKKHEYVTSSLH